MLQKRKDEAGGIARVAAPDIEELVIAALRHQVEDIDRQVVPDQTSPLRELSDRDLVALHVERIVLRSRYIDMTLRGGASPEGQGIADASSLAPSTLHLPWTSTSASARKGIAWKPSAQTNLDPATSDLLLTAIARARSWMNDLQPKVRGVGTHSRRSPELRTRSSATSGIPGRPLALRVAAHRRSPFAQPPSATPANFTVTTTCSRALPHGWAAQEHKLGIT